MINLISDTVTKPCDKMLRAMMKAEVGDDVFQSDPSVNKLQHMLSEMFGKEAALFCPSGTMANQLAIKVHTNPLDEIICDHYSHVYQYETGGYAFNSGVAIKTIVGHNGKITKGQIDEVINPDYDWLPNSRLVVLENSCNKGGGSYYTLEEITPITKLCKEKELKLHLDGARLFNVLVETNEKPVDIGDHFDSLSICISKGLGAPIGSLLLGSKEFIKKARKFRKVLGGGMRQVGYLAEACIYALENNVERLKIDNSRAKTTGDFLSRLSYVDHVRPVQTNIVIFEVKQDNLVEKLLSHLEKDQILATKFGHNAIRFVFHLDIKKEMMPKILSSLKSFIP